MRAPTNMAIASPPTHSDKTENDIVVVGARMHNLKNITATFPRNKLIVVTGVSGSGKSSLTINTLFAEGQRRYAESLSAYARQFMMRMEKPDVDYIKGLCPAIAIEQKVVTRTPRSTVGTMTELYDYFRLLFARIGKTISPISGQEVKKQDVTTVLNAIDQLKKGTKILILVPFQINARHRKHREELNILLQKGFSRIYQKINSEILRIDDLLNLDDTVLQKKLSVKKGAHNHIFILIDRMVAKVFDEDDIHRLQDSLSTAFYEGEGKLFLELDGNTLQAYNNKFELDGIVFEEPIPNLFSFNNPYGACTACEGLGRVQGIDENLVLPNPHLSVYEGAVAPWRSDTFNKYKIAFLAAAQLVNFPIHKPIAKLTALEYKALWSGIGKGKDGIQPFFDFLEKKTHSMHIRILLSRYKGLSRCTVCNGARLRPEASYVEVGKKNIAELCALPITDLKQWFDTLQLSLTDQQIAKRILIEIHQRIQTILDVGLGYLNLSRLANSLSGGESQRIQLARSLGSNLTDSLYILDEPSIGLHSRDTERLIYVLKNLRDLGNTVIVVEHDEMIMREADHIIDMGPLASHLGGEVVAAGCYQELLQQEKSLTGKYLKKELEILLPKQVRKWTNKIVVEGATLNNLKNIDVVLPLDVFCVISGVSGSGKTTLIKQLLYPVLQKLCLSDYTLDVPAGAYTTIKGDIKKISQIEMIDQNPIGRSSRSNPISYLGGFDEIRMLFSKQPMAKQRGYVPGYFSFNVDGGRCDACQGEGEQLVAMQFLADVHLTCESCAGKRFKESILEVSYNGKNIYEVLEMSVDDAKTFFETEKNIVRSIKPLQDVGLGYIKLGQPATTLSGGEAQRVKLASFLQKGSTQGAILFIFDEPSTGLHFHDIQKLLKSFNALVEQGHSLWVIEHNTDIIKSADWVIDLGPEAGEAGGNLVFAGIPKKLATVKESYTAKYLFV